MSLSDKIQIEIQNVIDQFAELVSIKHKIDKNEILKLWSGNTKLEVKETKTTKNISQTDSELLKLSKAELIEICKSKSLKVSGSKQDLVGRILGVEIPKTTKSSSSNKSSPFTKSAKTKTTKESEIPVIKKLIEKKPTIIIKRNKFDNYEHKETGFLFTNDDKTQKVYGKQNADGTVSDLTPEDINICNKFKFDIFIPENLDKKPNTKDDSEEGDEDIEEDIEIEEEIEEEEIEEIEEIEEDDEVEVEEEFEEEEYYEED